MNNKRNLPTINDLYTENNKLLIKQNELNRILNNEPKTEWLKQHPSTNTKIMYIPIERIEWLLTNIFIKWRVEILREGLIANSVYVTVRLHYLEPVSNEWNWVDGTGASPLQTNKGAGATDWTQIKSSAVQIGLPAAESYAVKDAAEKLGKLFGKDLNRADKIAYDTLAGKFDKPDIEILTKELIDLIDNIGDIGLQAMYKGDYQKAKKEGKVDINFVSDLIQKVRKDMK
jgi:hypothetical protein